MSKPWDQLPDENAMWYERFKRWLHQDKPRSILAIYNAERDKARKGRKKDIPGAWDQAARKYRWRARANAFDKAEQVHLDQELAKKRERQREKELQAAEKLREKADALMELPHLREEKKDDEGRVIILIPDHKAFKTAADLYAEARDHARSALEMTDKRMDLRKLSTDELLRLLAALDEDGGSSGEA
jgi:hypothetical protein